MNRGHLRVRAVTRASAPVTNSLGTTWPIVARSPTGEPHGLHSVPGNLPGLLFYLSNWTTCPVLNTGVQWKDVLKPLPPVPAWKTMLSVFTSKKRTNMWFVESVLLCPWASVTFGELQYLADLFLFLHQCDLAGCGKEFRKRNQLKTHKCEHTKSFAFAWVVHVPLLCVYVCILWTHVCFHVNFMRSTQV